MRSPWTRLGAASALTAVLAAVATPAAAQDFSSRPVRIIVPWAPGGNVDITARALAPGLGEALGTSVIVENKPGAGGTLGTLQVVKAAPDGHTLTLGSTAAVTISPAVFKDNSYDPVKDLTAVGPIHNSSLVITAANKLSVTTYEQLLALAKAKNGQLAVASPGIGSTNHLTIELVSRLAGFQYLHVPYKGAGPALQDLVGGQVDTMVDQIPPSLPHIKEGRIKAIAVTGLQRLAVLPDVPTLHELGLKDFQASTFTGLFAPAGLPPQVLEKLSAALRKAMADQKLRDRYTSMGVDILELSRPAFADFVASDFAKWKAVVESAKITAEQ